MDGWKNIGCQLFDFKVKVKIKQTKLKILELRPLIHNQLLQNLSEFNVKFCFSKMFTIMESRFHELCSF